MSKPSVVCKGVTESSTNYGRVVVDVPEQYATVIEKLGSRKGELVNIVNSKTAIWTRIFHSARGLFGYRSGFKRHQGEELCSYLTIIPTKIEIAARPKVPGLL